MGDRSKRELHHQKVHADMAVQFERDKRSARNLPACPCGHTWHTATIWAGEDKFGRAVFYCPDCLPPGVETMKGPPPD